MIDLLGLLAVFGAVAALWIAMDMLEKRRKTEKFFRELDAERKRRQQ